ncbi:MAG: hypothetical protein PVJ39_14265 [Gammaproteobacteria bacterium]|jgi:hypothetical protein
MSLFNKFLYLCCVAVLGIVLVGCSKDDGQNDEHFASSQQRALEKAKGVEGIVMDAEKKQREKLKEMEH